MLLLVIALKCMKYIEYVLIATYFQYMLEMLDNLLQNKAIRLEKFLHDIIPSVISCMVCTQICGKSLMVIMHIYGHNAYLWS